MEPTKPTALIRSSVSRTSTTSLSPLTTLNTPAGSPASRNSSARRSGTEGSRSEGLRMKALPAARAGPAFHSGIIAGKLKGVMPATTPSGWRMEYTSMPVPALSVNSPLSRCGAPTANSMTSRPRWMSPLASATVLPCSDERRRARESISAWASCRNFISTRARFCGLNAAHTCCASSALAMMASVSALLARGTRACTLPVLGSNTSANRSDVPGTRLPPTKCVNS